MVVLCPNCGNSIEVDNPVFCNQCGIKILANQVTQNIETRKEYCTGCGAELLPNAGFCMTCGQPRKMIISQTNSAQNVLAPVIPSTLERNELVFKVIYISLMVLAIIIVFTGGSFVNARCSDGSLRVDSGILDYKYSYLSILLKSNRIGLLIFFIIVTLGLTTCCIISALYIKYRLAGILSVLSMIFPVILSFVGTFSKRGAKIYSGYVGLGVSNFIYFILMVVAVIIICYMDKQFKKQHQ